MPEHDRRIAAPPSEVKGKKAWSSGLLEPDRLVPGPYGTAEATCYRWRKRYGDLDATEIRRLRQLEDENRRLKQLVAGLTWDKAMDRLAEKHGDACPL